MSNRILEGNETLSVISISDTYISHFKVKTKRNFYCVHRGDICDKIVVSNFGNLIHRDYYTLHAGDKITWKKASIMCHHAVEGYLPIFENKNSLYEFLSLLRSYDVDDITPPDAIYIGFISSTTQVSDQLLTS